MSLSSKDIEIYLEKYPNFKGVYSIDKLPLSLLKKPFGIVINLDESWKRGSHWTATYIPEFGQGIYFDSYGTRPPKNVVTFLERNCKSHGYMFNPAVFQGDLSIKCGYFCITFLKSCFSETKLPIMNCKTFFNEKLLEKMY